MINMTTNERQRPLFKLKYTIPPTNEVEFKFQLLQTVSHTAEQGIVQKETVGGDGGVTINTGRKIESITITGRIINQIFYAFGREPIVELNYSDIRNHLMKIKDNSYVCELIGHPYYQFQNRKWIIKDITTNLNEGVPNLSFTATLVEYRQANVKKSVENLVLTKDRQEFLDRLIRRQAGLI